MARREGGNIRQGGSRGMLKWLHLGFILNIDLTGLKVEWI